MKYAFLLVGLFGFVITSHAQAPDTILYDRAWNETKVKANMAFYRVVRKEGNLYKVEDHFKSGQLQMTGSFSSLKPEVQEGAFKYYDEKGKLIQEQSFLNNQLNGDYKKYYPSGNLHWNIHYKKGINEGLFVVFYENGETRRRDEYANGVVVSGKCFTAAGADTSYFPYEIAPTFTGGDDSMARYIDMHIDPVTKPADAPPLTVYVGFFVDEKGKVVDPRIVKGGNATFEEHALKVIREMPAWVPGRQDDKPVKMPVTVPIRF